MATLPLPFMEKSRVRVPEIVAPMIPLLLLFFLIPTIPLTFAAAAAGSGDGPPISYADHCAAVVPEYASAGDSNFTLNIYNGYFSGADDLFGDGDRDRLNESAVPRTRSFSFFSQSVRRTEGDGVLHVSGIAYLYGVGGNLKVHGRKLRYRTGVNFYRPPQPRLPRTVPRRTRLSVSLSGYWLETTGKVCMVGNGQLVGKGLELSAVFRLNYPKISNITSSVISGTFEFFDPTNDSIKFDPVTVVAYNEKKYQYTKIFEAEKFCSSVTHTGESLGLHSYSVCSLKTHLKGLYKLDYLKNCSTGSCNIFPKVANFTPNWMSVNQIKCSDDGKLHMYIGFSNVSSFGYNSVFNPENSLVGEGVWNNKSNQLCLVACHVLSSIGSVGSASFDECSIRICLWFSAVLTIEDQNVVAGRIWNVGDENDSNYFNMISLWSSRTYFDPIPLPGLKYKYTKLDNVRNSCPVSNSKSIGKIRYPDGRSPGDLRFTASVSGARINDIWGHFNPFSVGETILIMSPGQKNIILSGEDRNNSIMNVSYVISLIYRNSGLNVLPQVNGISSILAEGIYNSEKGSLCMVGCRNIILSAVTNQAKIGESMDCQIVIKIQLAPLKPKSGDLLKGTIRSTRGKKDALYFKPLEIISSPMYTEQAITSMWRMDVEIIMVLCSLTLSCIFIGMQLFHVKRNQEVLPSICITMLIVLTLGHMIPLVLNFEAFFFRSNKSSMFLRTGGWLEVNEVIVRIITMVAFLLQFRLVQVAWSSRSAAEDKKDLWIAEKKVLKICLPLYIAGGLVVLLVHIISSKPQPGQVVYLAAQRHSLWGDAISYGGLVLDGFLIPQVMFNIFSNSKEKALAVSFYLGNTVVRGLPHLYDAYRRGHYMSNFRSSYIYANPDEDFYSLVWDMVIPSGALLLAVLLCMQQRFGGGCLLPRRPGSSTGYEMVPVTSS